MRKLRSSQSLRAGQCLSLDGLPAWTLTSPYLENDHLTLEPGKPGIPAILPSVLLTPGVACLAPACSSCVPEPSCPQRHDGCSSDNRFSFHGKQECTGVLPGDTPRSEKADGIEWGTSRHLLFTFREQAWGGPGHQGNEGQFRHA